jgi:hypothetical protein
LWRLLPFPTGLGLLDGGFLFTGNGVALGDGDGTGETLLEL